MTKTNNLKGKHYNTVTGGYSTWSYKNGRITLNDGEHSYRILHFVTGMDGNEYRIFWTTSTLEDAITYLDKFSTNNEE